MDIQIRKAQWEILKCFAKQPRGFALSGGTAIELFYLKHRFSRDLDFFAPVYETGKIQKLVDYFCNALKVKFKLENEMTDANRARVRFYTCPIKGSSLPLKIDFIEDILFKKPKIKKFLHIPVYDSSHIYYQKILAVTGTVLGEDAIGREEIAGRDEARDVVDIYYLSRKIKPLRLFLKTLPRQYQRGMIRWYRTFSRVDFKLGALELNLYDKKFDPAGVISDLEREIEQFMEGIVE